MKRLILVAILLITACSSQPLQHHRYLLRSDADYEPADLSVARIGLGTITVATYLDSPGLVLETADRSVRPARYHSWAEPLRESLRPFLGAEISAALGSRVHSFGYGGDEDWSRRVEIRIDQLHGTFDGSARIVAYWAILDNASREVIHEGQFRDSEPLGSDGYDSLVEAEAKLLRRFAVAIAASLQDNA